MTTAEIISFDVPAPAALRRIREGLGLSQAELAEELGFGRHGEHVVRFWESGSRYGKPYAPTPLAWRALRFMTLTVEAYRSMGMGRPETAWLKFSLPEALR